MAKQSPKTRAKRSGAVEIQVPAMGYWDTTDAQELARRQQRAREENFEITNLHPRHPVFSNFEVGSGSGLRYSVEIRDIRFRRFACECVDFRINGLGTCKHAEAVLNHLDGRFKRLFAAAAKNGSPRLDLVPDDTQGTLQLEGSETERGRLPRAVRGWFDDEGVLRGATPEEAVAALEELRKADHPLLRISQEVAPWLAAHKHAAEKIALRREYEQKVQRGEWPAHETLVPLFPYQREGMLHLAFTGRALLADEMGLGKTIQAIAAAALLHRLGQVERALVVTPASLKTEWEEQIRRFTPLGLRLVFGDRKARLASYSRAEASFFTIVNYEQMLADGMEVNARLKPDLVILDEAQRIKNWNAKTTQAIKRLRSRYAFVLTGTPIENRIDEMHSLMDFVDPRVLGALFRFNRDYYVFGENGRPTGYRNLQQLHEKIAPYMLRRRKTEVETELPERTERNHFVKLTYEQRNNYVEYEGVVAKLALLAKRRPLTQPEQDRLMLFLAMMRMTCDTNYILDRKTRTCPKCDELETILEEIRDSGDSKVIIFSEWERMLELVRDVCRQLKLGFAWHTGSVPQQRRRAEISSFKNDPACRVFLSTDSGATGLNLQAASVVINCDLPWNPAKYEQRIARAWRKHQSRPVTVINLISEETIEHRMMGTLAGKQALSDGVLDLRGNLNELKITSGRQLFLERLRQLATPSLEAAKPTHPQTSPARILPSDRPLAFAQLATERLGKQLLRCEERFPTQGAHSVLCVVVECQPQLVRPELEQLHGELFGPGKTDPLSPTELLVIDRATDDALQRLIAAGLVTSTTRAARTLATDSEVKLLAPLSEEEKSRIEAHRAQAARRLELAELLQRGGFTEESVAPLCEAIVAMGRALAMRERLPVPADLGQIGLAPLASFWGDALNEIRAFAETGAHPELATVGLRRVLAALPP